MPGRCRHRGARSYSRTCASRRRRGPRWPASCGASRGASRHDRGEPRARFSSRKRGGSTGGERLNKRGLNRRCTRSPRRCALLRARARRPEVLAGRTGLRGNPQVEHERRVHMLLTGAIPTRRSRVRAAAAVAAANSGPLSTNGLYSGEAMHRPLAQKLERRQFSSPVHDRRLTACVTH